MLRAAETQRATVEAARERDALSQTLAEREGELDKLRRRSAELEIEREAAGSALDRLRDQARRSEAERTSLAADLDSAQQDRDGLAVRLDRAAVELQAERRLSARRAKALEEAEGEHQQRIRAARAQLVDVEAALSRAKAPNGLFPALSRALAARKLVRSGLIESEWYRQTYPDAQETGLAPAAHYLQIGFARGYKPNPFFDTRFYLEHNEDVLHCGLNPLLHYHLHGWREGRDPGPNFRTTFYLETNPDVREKGIDPLAHYLHNGRHEGRLPTPLQ